MQPNANPNLSPTHRPNPSPTHMCNPNLCGQQSCSVFRPLSRSTEGHSMKPDTASTEVHHVPYRPLQTRSSRSDHLVAPSHHNKSVFLGFRLVLLWIHASWMSVLTSDELFNSSWHLLNFSIFHDPPLADKVGEFFDYARTSRYRPYQCSKQAASRHITQSHHCSVMFRHCNDKKADAQTWNHRTKNQKQPESLHVNKTCLFE